MARITKYLNQIAIYWAPLGNDRFGQPTWDKPREVRCRWEDVAEEFLASDGQRQVSRSKVIVEEKLETEGHLWLSTRTTADSPGSALYDLPSRDINPTELEGAYPIKAFGSVPNRKATQFYREARL